MKEQLQQLPLGQENEVDETEPRQALFVQQVIVSNEGQAQPASSDISSKRECVNLFEKVEKLKKLNHPNLCEYLDLKEQIEVQNHWLIFQQCSDKSIQDVVSSRCFNNSGIDGGLEESQLIDIAYAILLGLVYLQEKEEPLEIGFFSPAQIFCFPNGTTSGKLTYRLGGYGQLFLEHFAGLPDQLEELLFRPPEYYILGQDKVKHGKFSEGKGEIWSLGMLLRYCMFDGVSDNILNAYLLDSEGIQMDFPNDNDNNVDDQDCQIKKSFCSRFNQGKLPSEVNKSQFISDLLQLCCEEAFIDNAVFMETGYLQSFISPIQEYLNGYKSVKMEQYSFGIRNFIKQCLYLNPKNRSTPRELLEHPIFTLKRSQKYVQKVNNSNTINVNDYFNDSEDIDGDNGQDEEYSYKYNNDLNQPSKSQSLQSAYDEVVRKQKIDQVEKLFPLECLVDILQNEIERSITLSHPQLLAAVNSSQQSSICQGGSVRIDCKIVYEKISKEIIYCSNVLRSVKDPQMIIEYLSLDAKSSYNNGDNDEDCEDYQTTGSKGQNAGKKNINQQQQQQLTMLMDQSQFLNNTLVLNESTIFSTTKNLNNTHINNTTQHYNNLDLSTILNDPELSLCSYQGSNFQQQQSQSKVSQKEKSSPKNNQNINTINNILQHPDQIQEPDENIVVQQLQTTTQQQLNRQVSLDKQQQQQQQQSQQALSELDKSSTSISFGFFKKMKISEKVSKFWGSKTPNTDSQGITSAGQSGVASSVLPSIPQDAQNPSQQSTNVPGKSQANSQPNGNDLFANSSTEIDGEFQPFPANIFPPQNGYFSSRIRELLFYLNLFFEDRRILSPKQIPLYLIQVDLPRYLRPELYKKVLVLPRLAPQLFNFLCETPLMYPEKQSDIKQIDNDLRRCHQYSLFCASTNGQLAIRKTLHAFLNLHVNYYYVQGMDAMAFMALQAAPENSEAAALLILQEIVKKSLFMHNSDKQKVEDYIFKEKIPLFKWLLKLEDPVLSQYLEERNFLPEIYAISWFLNLFSMVFEMSTALRIWDILVCDSNFVICFAVSLMIELKDHLMVKDSNELLENIRNLEGIISSKNSWKYAQYLMRTLPESFLTLTHLNETQKNEYQMEFFADCPWEIPLAYAAVIQRPIFFASIFDLLKQKHVIYIDVRSKEEYETACVKNSLYAHFIGGRVNEVVLAYLEKKSSKLTNFDSFSKSPSNELMSLIVIVFNYEKQQDMLDSVQQCLAVGVRRLIVLNGGIQSVMRDRPEMLEFKHRIHPINYYKRKQH